MNHQLLDLKTLLIVGKGQYCTGNCPDEWCLLTGRVRREDVIMQAEQRRKTPLRKLGMIWKRFSGFQMFVFLLQDSENVIAVSFLCADFNIM